MNKLAFLQQQAIKAAKNQDWQTAISSNLEILESNTNDIGALNRLGVAYLQTGDTKAAKKQFSTVIEIDKSNSIAKKHLDRIKNKQTAAAPTFSTEHFIEEPGITKIVELHRLTGKDVLEGLSVGQACQLKPKSRYISIETEDAYVGSLPEDLSFRLSKLINTGNEYSCFIYSASSKNCSVYLKETVRSKRNEHVNSFPISKGSFSALNEIDERFLLEDDVPIEIVETDTDEEKTLDSYIGGDDNE